MDKPEKLATLGTQDLGRRLTKTNKKHNTENKKTSNMNPNINRGWTQVYLYQFSFLEHKHLNPPKCLSKIDVNPLAICLDVFFTIYTHWSSLFGKHVHPRILKINQRFTSVISWSIQGLTSLLLVLIIKIFVLQSPFNTYAYIISENNSNTYMILRGLLISPSTNRNRQLSKHGSLWYCNL